MFTTMSFSVFASTVIETTIAVYFHETLRLTIVQLWRKEQFLYICPKFWYTYLLCFTIRKTLNILDGWVAI